MTTHNERDVFCARYTYAPWWKSILAVCPICNQGAKHG